MLSQQSLGFSGVTVAAMVTLSQAWFYPRTPVTMSAVIFDRPNCEAASDTQSTEGRFYQTSHNEQSVHSAVIGAGGSALLRPGNGSSCNTREPMRSRSGDLVQCHPGHRISRADLASGPGYLVSSAVPSAVCSGM